MSQQKSISLPARDNLTALQTNTLLSVMGQCLNALVNPMFRFSSTDEEGPQLPGEAKIAVENTIINTCARLDEILNDPTRWDLKLQDSLEAGALEIQAAHKDLIEAQAVAIKNLDCPHVRFKPTLFRLVSKDWLALLGDIKDLDNALVGIGTTPAEALRNFDLAFDGELPQYLMDWLNIRAAAIDTGIESPPFPKQPKETNEQDKNDPVDETRDSTTEGREGGRREPRNHRKGSGPEQDGSGPQS
jgi:hypothetical protein